MQAQLADLDAMWTAVNAPRPQAPVHDEVPDALHFSCAAEPLLLRITIKWHCCSKHDPRSSFFAATVSVAGKPGIPWWLVKHIRLGFPLPCNGLHGNALLAIKYGLCAGLHRHSGYPSRSASALQYNICTACRLSWHMQHVKSPLTGKHGSAGSTCG